LIVARMNGPRPRPQVRHVVATAPSPELFTAILERELDLLVDAGGYPPPPDVTDAVPFDLCGAAPCLRRFAARASTGATST
jgi:hypothetical protein